MSAGSHVEATHLLANTPLFAGVAPRDLRDCSQHAKRRAYAAGEVLFSQNDRPEGAFIAERGTIRLVRRTSHGDHITVGEEAAPCLLITPGLFDGGSNGVTATALQDGTGYLLPADAFKDLCRRYPDVLLRLLTDVCQRVRQASEFIELMTVGNIRQRVARVLLDLADECGKATFNLPCSQAKLALGIGTVREVVFRHLKQLQSDGILHFHGSEIVVEDVAKLQVVAGARIGSDHIFGPQATPSIPAYIAPRNRRE